MKILFLSPILEPCTGGASIYCKLITEAFLRDERVKAVTVVSEKHPKRPCHERVQGVELNRSLVSFAGSTSSQWRRALAYAYQQIQLRNLPAWIRQTEATVLIIHGYFFWLPNILDRITRSCRRRYPQLKLALDLRDPSLPAAHFASLDHFDLLIACSERIRMRLQSHPSLHARCQVLPIPFSDEPVDTTEADELLKQASIAPGTYLYAATGIVDKKGFPLLFKSWQTAARQRERLDLVVVGRSRDWKPEYAEAVGNSRLHHLGEVPNPLARALAARAAATVCVSEIEAPSRYCLEAISAGTPTLLPPSVPEFDHIDRRHVAERLEPEALAEQLLWMTETQSKPAYSLEAHQPDRVASRYIDLLLQ